MAKKKSKRLIGFPSKNNLDLYLEAKANGYKSTISWSQLKTFHTCNYKWYLEKVEKVKISDQSIYLVIGNAMHRVLQEWVLIIYNTSVKKADEYEYKKRILEEMTTEFKNAKLQQGNGNFTNVEEFRKYYRYCLSIFEYFKRKRNLFFTTKNTQLIGVEYQITSDASNPNVAMIISIDLILYDIKLDKYIVYDFKITNRGWSEYKKKNWLETWQLILYKKYLAEELGISIDKIQIEYLIARCIIPEESEYPIRRVGTFTPNAGKVNISKMGKKIEEFVDTAFYGDGTINTNKSSYIKNKTENSCRYCIFNNTIYCQ